jgi:hypothetical protein
MERAAFLIEPTGERLACLLNPADVVVRRQAGVERRRSLGGHLTGAGLADDPLLHTGGGRTEIDLDLLFDVDLAGSTVEADDVRALTRPLWDLAENRAGDDGYGRAATVRFVWGKSWNVPGVVVAVAERLEQFGPAGAPRRSWLRLRLVRAADAPTTGPTTTAGGPGPAVTALPLPLDEGDLGPGVEVPVHEVLGGPAADGATVGERLDELAARYYGDASLWRVLAAVNGVTDPARVPPGRLLRVPPLDALQPAPGAAVAAGSPSSSTTAAAR